MGYRVKKQVSTDIQEWILSDACASKKKIFFFGDTDEVLMKVNEELNKRYKDIIITGLQSGYDFKNEEVLRKINNSGAEILFVGLGVTKQENWIIENHNMLDISLIISVGGWFQYLGGIKKRAPEILRQYHLEWLYKLTNETGRVWKRYLFILPVFFIRVITGKIKLELSPIEDIDV